MEYLVRPRWKETSWAYFCFGLVHVAFLKAVSSSEWKGQWELQEPITESEGWDPGVPFSPLASPILQMNKLRSGVLMPVRLPSPLYCGQPLLVILAKYLGSFFFFNYCSIVGLHCCISFRCIAKWISFDGVDLVATFCRWNLNWGTREAHTYTYIHYFLDYFPI